MPECSIECSVPVFDNAYVDADMEQYPARATVTCHENYVSTKTNSKLYNITEESLICNKTGSWIPDITCTYFLNIFNMALYKPARQSSTYVGFVANLATDGLWYPDFNDGSCMHADLLEESSWWEVDLLETYSIRRVVILIRKFALFAVRFHDVTITVGMKTNPKEFCAFYQGHEVHDSPIHLYCERRILGRYVRITKLNDKYHQDNLAMCEVGVYED
ncbi:uncharacterized protein LOC132717261 [Ruditapes philippinarum]|uniref:uncharacterized protein LOC132717261 n=1 Tax=Ruditapes philippinarum TaxID=129788 RepID=UPI00295C03EC|nr:uncharacterized protein LOC132717261 [Ruditapes philippinarum]